MKSPSCSLRLHLCGPGKTAAEARPRSPEVSPTPPVSPALSQGGPLAALIPGESLACWAVTRGSSGEWL